MKTATGDVFTISQRSHSSEEPIQRSFIMAALRAPSHAFLSAFLSVARAQLSPPAPQPCTKRLPLLHRWRTTAHMLPAALIPIPGLLRDIWDGILNAVPKKKTSHMKKRHRQMAGKALKDVTALNKCSACGRVKRAHVLCPYCVQSEYKPRIPVGRRDASRYHAIAKYTDNIVGVRQWLRNGFKTKREVAEEEREKYEVYNQERKDMGLKPLEIPKELKEDRSTATGSS